MLLGAHDPVVLRRYHEPLLDRWAGGVRSCREDTSFRPLDWPLPWIDPGLRRRCARPSRVCVRDWLREQLNRHWRRRQLLFCVPTPPEGGILQILSLPVLVDDALPRRARIGLTRQLMKMAPSMRGAHYARPHQ